MTSLSDVWGDENEMVPIISAKKTVEEEISKPEVSINDDIIKAFNALLIEVHELRREQTKRCSVYMMMIGILFGILILYIDRLNYTINTKRHQMNHPFV